MNCRLWNPRCGLAPGANRSRSAAHAGACSPPSTLQESDTASSKTTWSGWRPNDVGSWQDLKELAFRTHGFYRPLVSASFTSGRSSSLRAVAVGMRHHELLPARALDARHRVGRHPGLLRPSAIAVSAIWALNFGINMAVLWLSGRTAPWLVLCSLIAAGLLVRRRPLLAGMAVLFAAFAKEEAVMLPVIFTGWALILQVRGREAFERRGRPGWRSRPICCSRQDECDDAGRRAPGSYSFTFAPMDLAQNVLEYLDRAGTFSVIVLAARVPRLLAAPTGIGDMTRRLCDDGGGLVRGRAVR